MALEIPHLSDTVYPHYDQCMCDLHMNHYGVGVKVSMCLPLPR